MSGSKRMSATPSSSTSTAPWPAGSTWRARSASSGPPAAWAWPSSTTGTSIRAIISSSRTTSSGTSSRRLWSNSWRRTSSGSSARIKKTPCPGPAWSATFLRVCHGECPKNRFVEAPDGGLALNYLCAGYKAFFKHADKAMRIMADLLRQNRPASEVMAILAGEGMASQIKAGQVREETIPAPAAAE